VASRIRVLMLVDRFYPGGGGAEVFTVGLAGALPTERFDVRVCTTRGGEGFLVEELGRTGIPYLTLGRRRRLDMAPFARLRSYLRAERIDVLHTHMFGSNLWGSVIGRVARVPVVVAHEHTWSYQGKPLRKLLDGQVIGRLADSFVAVSRADGARMIALEKVKPEKVTVIPPAFVPRPDGPVSPVRPELGIPDDAPVVGTVVSMRPQKALEVMIDAVVLLRERLPAVRLVVVGDGDSRAGWEAYAAERGLGETALFLGVRTDVQALIESFDVSTLSSDFEGTPLFVLESMAQRTPVVSTAVGGLPDVIEDGVSGVLVPPRDPRALADALAALLEDPKLRQKLATAAHGRLPEFSIERIASRFAELYEELLRPA
jgi:glycosyltransferase involved in cell wall biosynthesis